MRISREGPPGGHQEGTGASPPGREGPKIRHQEEPPFNSSWVNIRGVMDDGAKNSTYRPFHFKWPLSLPCLKVVSCHSSSIFSDGLLRSTKLTQNKSADTTCSPWHYMQSSLLHGQIKEPTSLHQAERAQPTSRRMF